MLDREDERDGIFKITKQITCQNRDITESSCIKIKDGKVVTDEIKIREIWKEYFDKLLYEEYVWVRVNCPTKMLFVDQAN